MEESNDLRAQTSQIADIQHTAISAEPSKWFSLKFKHKLDQLN